jgi:nitric oxide reductase NorQ protein
MQSPDPKPYTVGKDVTYIPQGNELDIAVACHELGLPLMLRGPTGTGKTTLVQYLSRHLQLPLIGEPCNEDTLASDLIGRNLREGWKDGSAARSLRFKDGAIYYLDELGEARPNSMVVVHELTDDRRTLDVNGELLKAPEGWTVVASYNPAYQLRSNVKPSTAQRFVTVDVPFPEANVEKEVVRSYLERSSGRVIEDAPKPNKYKPVVRGEVPVDNLIKLANDYRRMAEASDSIGLREGPGPRLTARTAALIEHGIPPLEAILVGMINPVTHDPEQKEAMLTSAKGLFRR